jgi:hypothetical protein
LDPKLGGIKIGPAETVESASDMYRLVGYFEQHIEKLRQKTKSRSHVFATYELGFNVQALQGHVWTDSDGEHGSFALLSLINVGRKENTWNTYVGGESDVLLDSIENFMACFKETLDLLTDKS